ncbi:MAG TPA: acetylglutamate kinase [Candidatus Tyrphobacter sp.]
MIVVKYGGAALDGAGASDPLLAEIAALHERGERIVLVHGGGPEIDRRLSERGIVTRRVEGQRITDAATLEVVESVLCGTLNKRLVRACLALGIRAAGISGQDGPTLLAQTLKGAGGADLGFVGETVDCDVHLVRALFDAGYVPIIAPLAISRDGTQAYNVNADLAAAAIAGALATNAFIIVTNVSRVLRDPDDPASGIGRLTPEEARAFAASEACRSSMKPKLLAAVAAVGGGANAAYICAAKSGTIARALAGDATIVSAPAIAPPAAR